MFVPFTPVGKTIEAKAIEIKQRLGLPWYEPVDPVAMLALVPNPNQPFEFTANALDRAAQISQDGWVIDYGDYTGNGADLLPKRFTLHRDQVRVRVAVDHWNLEP